MINVKSLNLLVPFFICLLLSFGIQASDSDTSNVNAEDNTSVEVSTSNDSGVKSEPTTAVDDATKSEEKPEEDPEEDEEEEPDCD